MNIFFSMLLTMGVFMKRIKLTAFLFVTSIFLFNACSAAGRNLLGENTLLVEEHTIMSLTTPVPVKQNLPITPIQLMVWDIPQGAEPAEFLRELGYDSFVEHEFLRWGSDWIALQTNTVIRDLRIIFATPHYEAFFTDEWRFVRHYTYSHTRLYIDLLPNEPLVMAWQADGQGITGTGLDGVSYVDADGNERFFILQQANGVAYLEEFTNSPHMHSSPKISIIRPSPEIELVVAWFLDFRPANGRAARALGNDFMQQFESYTVFDDPTWISESMQVES